MTGPTNAARQRRASGICVDRCVCFKRPFTELLAIARKTGARTLEELQEETEFGLSCRLCNPYVRRMLVTGEEIFTELLEDAPPPDPEE
jgi:NAD(P)H-nitrite reductase large subunit